MADIPKRGETPLIRTDFNHEAAWNELIESARKPSEDGFLANLHIVDQQEFEGIAAEQLGKSAAYTNHAILFVADKVTMTHSERPVLCVDVFSPERKFRVIPSELWSAENNLSLANLDFEDFTEGVASDGIFRGF
jgi:uncharacterized protein DUF6924